MGARLAFLVALLWMPLSAAEPRSFLIDEIVSSAIVHVGKTGIASFAGHDHQVVAQSLRGEVIADLEDLSRSSVDLSVDARSLKVSPEGEPPEDVPKVQQTMHGPQILDVARFTAIRFRSKEVTARQRSPGVYELRVTGELSLHGTAKAIAVPVRLESRGDTLTATGKMVLKQTDFGIAPTSAAGGLVKVENEVTITFRIVARATRP